MAAGEQVPTATPSHLAERAGEQGTVAHNKMYTLCLAHGRAAMVP